MGRKASIVAGRLAATGAAAAVVFVITNPFAVIEFKAYIGQILAQNAMVSGLMDAPYTRQYTGTAPYLYFIQQLSQWGLGWPLGLVAWGGFAWALVVAARRKAGPALVVMLAWALPYFAVTGAFHTKFLRYMAPLLPVLLVFGASAAMAAFRWLGRRWGRPGRAVWAVLAVFTAVVAFGWALAFTGIYRQEHPWIAASRWIYTHIPDGKKLLTEHWDDSLPLTLDELPGKPASRAYQRVELPLWDPDTTAKLDILVDELSTADYIVLASNRLYAPIGRLRSRYPMANQYYRMLFSGDLGYRQIAEFSAYPRLGGLTIRDDNADESFTVYDHPRVLVFENAGRLKPELLRARLGRYLPAEAQGHSGELRAVTKSQDQAFLSGVNTLACHSELPIPVVAWARGVTVIARSGRGPESHAALLPATKQSLAHGWDCFGAAAPRNDRHKQLPMPRGGVGAGGDGHCEERPLPRVSRRAAPSDEAISFMRQRLLRAAALAMTCHRQDNEAAGRAVSSTRRPPGLARYLPQAPAPDAPLTLPQPVDTLPVVSDFRWNPAASVSAPLSVLVWWLAMSLFGWLAWPLLFPLLGGLRDRGFGLARVAGWLLVGWTHWLGVSLGWWQNRLGAIAAVLGLLALAGIAAGFVQRRRLAAFWAERRWLLLGEEVLFAGAFLAFVGVRLLDPDLWQPWNGGEKFMEFAFLNAILRSPHFPPYDPYFAGGILNYYYFGLYLVSLLIKLTGIAPEVAFNLAVPGLFALTAVGLFSVAYNLASGFGSGKGGGAEGRRSRTASPPRCSSAPPPPLAGGLAVLLALLMGNLRGLSWLLRVWGSAVTGSGLPEFDYWAASRVIPNTINEFPLWSFVFADLHPHMIAMPFGLLVVGLALNWVMDRDQGSGIRGQGSGVRGQETGIRGRNRDRGQELRRSAKFPVVLVSLSTSLLMALALGVLGAINTWDLPTYALLVAGAFVLAGWRARRVRGLIGAALLAVVTAGAAVAAYLPFYRNYQAQVGEGAGPLIGRFLGWVRAASPLSEWLTIWGFFLFLATVYITVSWRLGSEQANKRAGGLKDGERGEAEGRGARGAEEQANEREWEQSEPKSAPIGEVVRWNTQERGARGASVRWSVKNQQASTGQGHRRRDLTRASRWRIGRCWLFLRLQTLKRPGARIAAQRLIALLALLGVLALLAGAGRPTAAVAALPLCLALPLIFRRRAAAGEAFLVLLLVLGLGIVAGIELVYVRDFLQGGDWYRMNTLFKFSVPAWLLLGLAGGVMLPAVWVALRSAPGSIRLLVRAALAVMLAGGLVFLVFGVRARVQDRFPGPRPAVGTLDATAYMTVGRYTWPSGTHPIQLANEREAIRWLLDNVSGSPVIAEAPAGGYDVDGQPVGYDYYRAGGLRVASLTGFPTFVGQHQYEQRPSDQVGPRFEQGKAFFTTTDIARARQLMADLRVGYVYVGTLERILFSEDSLRKFDIMAELGDLEVVHRNPEVTLYRVVTGHK